MTTTPNLPPLPESAPSRYDAWGRPMPIYLEEHMQAHALAAYQAGGDAALADAEAFLDARYKDALKRRDEAEDEPEFQTALTGEAFGHLQAILGLRNLKSNPTP